MAFGWVGLFLAIVAPVASSPGSSGIQTLRGLAYGPLPSKSNHYPFGYPADMLQAGYAAQWGANGRDDLGTIKALGATAVRLYHSMGIEREHDHSGFLDRARDLGLDVFPGVHNSGTSCPNNDCYDSVKSAVQAGFQIGFQTNGRWHPAISTIVLLNEPELSCHVDVAVCRVKKALSALDGFLDAEKEMNVDAGHVQLTLAWSFGIDTSIDGKVTGPGIYGFQDMVAGVANPSLAGYAPRSSLSELAAAFTARWIHCVNTQAPWSFVKSQIAPHFTQFLPHKWFIGEYGANGQTRAVIEKDLQSMDEFAGEDASFMGHFVFQFQSAYEKGSGSELNYGLFSLGDEKVGDADVCLLDASNTTHCDTFPILCLDTHLPWFSKTPELDHRADAVAKAWGGSVGNKGLCSNVPRPPSPAPKPPSPKPQACDAMWGICPNSRPTDTCQGHLDYAIGVQGHDCSSSLAQIIGHCPACAGCSIRDCHGHGLPSPAPKPPSPKPQACDAMWGICPNGRPTDTCQSHLDYAIGVQGHSCSSALAQISGHCPACGGCSVRDCHGHGLGASTPFVV